MACDVLSEDRLQWMKNYFVYLDRHMERVPRDTDNHRTLGPQPEPGWARIPVEHTPSKSGLPTSVVLGYSNGGEFRKSFHGLSPPYAQVEYCLIGSKY